MSCVNICDIRQYLNKKVSLFGWVQSVRSHKRVCFLDLVDVTGKVQVVISRHLCNDIKLYPETAIYVHGEVVYGERGIEVNAESLEVVAESMPVTPPLRTASPIEKYRNKVMLHKRHLYLRHPYFVDIFRFRHYLLRLIRRWFDEKGFVEFHAPILTPVPLYSDESAVPVSLFGEKVFLTQCVGFYLEAAVHALGKVYNIGPSFRNEKSTGKRYLAEYWHIKAEAILVKLEDLIDLVEDLLSFLLTSIEPADVPLYFVHLDRDAMAEWAKKLPWPRITYNEALQILDKRGVYLDWGRSLNAQAEQTLSEMFASPFWIVELPRTTEPFPYVLDRDNPQVTKTADLILPDGFGELLGVAEKIYDLSELKIRMKEKGKWNDSRYEWIKEIRQYGCVPHGGIGMGFERLIRWLLRLEHVRDAIPFPREFRRRVYP